MNYVWLSHVLKGILVIGIFASIGLTYYTKIVKHDYEIFINEDGLPILEE